jgi:hypothetical protein
MMMTKNRLGSTAPVPSPSTLLVSAGTSVNPCLVRGSQGLITSYSTEQHQLGVMNCGTSVP